MKRREAIRAIREAPTEYDRRMGKYLLFAYVYGAGPVVLSRRSRMRAWLNRLRRALAGDAGLVAS